MSICKWFVSVKGDQKKFKEFCEEFMSPDIEVFQIKDRTICMISLDPNKPIDSTGSMPSLTDQLRHAGFTDIVVEEPKGF